ncbi:MAG TPA: CPBP family intramembrane glutamic endopeptidase [Mycobacteriales bacterium]|nr:CPBP family intramembrane glutamic endopeptidase [Mycobacteriales bacterium]
MRVLAEGSSLAGTVRVLAVLLAGYLVLAQPVVGAWSHRRFRRSADTRRGRLGRYRRTAAVEWGLVAASLALVAAAPGLDLADIGVRWPRGSAYTLVGTAGLVLSVALLVGLRRRVDRGVDVVAPAEVSALLPRTAAERRAFAGLAVTAGICEEVLYRGVLLAIAVAVLPGLAPWRLVVLSALAFALAHAYQGVAGMLTALVLGGSLAVLYVGSGSLLLPVVYHVLVDLRVLVLAVDRYRPRPRHRARPAVPERTGPA